jgi:hypothetical protein
MALKADGGLTRSKHTVADLSGVACPLRPTNKKHWRSGHVGSPLKHAHEYEGMPPKNVFNPWILKPKKYYAISYPR